MGGVQSFVLVLRGVPGRYSAGRECVDNVDSELGDGLGRATRLNTAAVRRMTVPSRSLREADPPLASRHEF